ncbi:CheY-like chemotaxis protein [Bradyrhizobium sp. i1.4.4]|uniref:Response regulatory domain-containing protein n=1 Tax=Bradyrhizobium japonicum TaxID=375 RepID=A0A1Y2JXT3_BRAJP|nr:response regulator [Bradyrhizobium japonicum]OSJ36951.1 hypothetical protein BSZ19_01705 [Bradyrhizobium japonicum]
MNGVSILLVEDEALIRMMLVGMIEELGHSVVAEAGNCGEGQSLAKSAAYDLAILDINLQGTNCGPIAKTVVDRGLPLLFLSGYGSAGVPAGYEGVRVVNKPCTIEFLKLAIERCLAEHSTQQSSDEVTKTS